MPNREASGRRWPSDEQMRNIVGALSRFVAIRRRGKSWADHHRPKVLAYAAALRYNLDMDVTFADGRSHQVILGWPNNGDVGDALKGLKRIFVAGDASGDDRPSPDWMIDDEEHQGLESALETLSRALQDADSAAVGPPTTTGDGRNEDGAPPGPTTAPPRSETTDLVMKLRRRKQKVPAALVEYMGGRDPAPFEDIARHVHGSRVSDNAIIQNVARTNKSLIELGSRLRFECASGYVFKRPSPE